jgi:hypothetical protein
MLALLLVTNIALYHSVPIMDMVYWTLRKLMKPKFKVGEFVVIRGHTCEIVHISARGMPYSYYCLPLNKNKSIIGNYYPQKALKPLSDLTKSLL